MKNQAENNPFNVGLVAICSFIGVGFITGAEIWFYFARFGAGMLAGLVVFGVLMVLLIKFSLNSDKFQSAKLIRLKTAILGLSEFLIASAMTSGLLETSKTLFGKFWPLVFLCSILIVSFLFFKDLKSFVFYNYFVAFFVIFVIMFLLLNNNYNSLDFSFKINYKNITLSALFSGIYVFMNISEIRPILSNYQTLKTKRRKNIFAFIISLVLILSIITLSISLFCNVELVGYSMPLMLLFKNYGGAVYYIFLIGLVLAMISTAESCLIGVMGHLNFSKQDEIFYKIIVIILLLVSAQIPFAIFVKVVYPAIAILNFLLFLSELFVRSKK